MSMDSSDSSSSLSSDEDALVSGAAGPEAEFDELDSEAAALRLQEIHASVLSHNARIEALLSLIPSEQFKHLSDQENEAPPVLKSKKQRKTEILKRQIDVKKAQKAVRAEQASLRTRGNTGPDDKPSSVVKAAPASAEKPSLAELRARLGSKIRDLQAARAPTREGLIADRKAKRERQAERKKEERRLARKEAKKADGISAASSLERPVDPPPPPSAQDALALERVKRGGTTLAFGHLDFAPRSAVRAFDQERKGKAKERPSRSSHDPKQALAALEERQRYLATHSEQARERAEEKDRWTAMTARAEGAKVYDKEALLKKALKRQDKQKKRSRDKWAERHQTVEEAKAARQQLRAYNLAKRKEEANQPKGKRKARPGFEGGRGTKRKTLQTRSKPPGFSTKPKRKETSFSGPSS